MAKLDTRLLAVASQICGAVHADIGSDHGYLIRDLLASGRIRKGIAIENKPSPYSHSLKTLAGMNADVRLADGLTGLVAGEADSLSMSGIGGEAIARILATFPDRLPPQLVLQPNCRPEAVRRWCREHRFHLTVEQFVEGRHPTVVMNFQQSSDNSDPAYEGLPRWAELFGPLLIRDWKDAFAATIREECRYLSLLSGRTLRSQHRLDALTDLLDRQGESRSSNDA